MLDEAVNELPAKKVKRSRWLAFINGFSSGIGFAIFLIVIMVWLSVSNTQQASSLVGFVILAIIVGLSIFLISLTAEIYHQARIGPSIPIIEEAPPQSKMCSKCGAEMRYVPKLRKHYCDNCKSYE